jgi:hypothetical protein
MTRYGAIEKLHCRPRATRASRQGEPPNLDATLTNVDRGLASDAPEE